MDSCKDRGQCKLLIWPHFLIKVQFILLAFFAFIFLMPSTVSAAANLTVSSASLAADGKTITVNIGGVSGSLSPASGITGFTVKVGSMTYPSASITSSGSAVTFTTSAFINSTSTVTVDLATSPTSNLTDGGGNTPQGQTGQSVTNGSAITLTPFDATDSAIIFSGVVPTISTTFNLGARNGQLDVLMTGTCANFSINSSAGATYTFTVDGSTSVVTSVGSQQRWSLFCGLSDTAHRVKITSSGGSLNSAHLFEVNGTAPALSRVTDIGNIYNIVDSSTQNSLLVSGGWTYDATYTTYKTYWSDEKISFNSAATQIDAWIYNKSAPLYLEQDGVVIASSTPSGASTWGYLTLASNLDGQTHTYSIGTGGYVSTYSHVYGLALVGGTLGAQPASLSHSIGGYGDSITAANQICLSNESFLYGLASRLNVIPINRGIGGSRVIGSGDTRTADITGATPAPSYVTLLYGINDIGTSAAFLTSYTNMLNSLTTGLSTTNFLVMGLLQNSYSAQRNVDIRSAISANGSSNLKYIDTSGWTLPDMNGNHPGPVGYTNMTNYLAPYVSTTAYTASGPTNGLPNMASSNFTVTLANSGAFDSTTTIAITVPDGTITAVAAGGTITSNGTSNVTVAPAKDSSNFTFTYTPTSVGAKTLAFTNGQGWTNPSSTVYQVSEPTIANFSPADNSTGMVSGGNLVLTFDDAVYVGSGNITIKKTSDNSVFEAIDVTSGSVTGSGTSSITINPASDFSYETGYYIQIDAAAFDDVNGNSYAGISDTTTWNFTTENTPTCPAITNASTYNAYPTCGVATCNSGYILTNGTCVTLGGGGSAPAPAVGSGANGASIGLGQTSLIGNITTQGTNVLAYVNSQANFTAPVSSTNSNQSHSFLVNSLDLANQKVTLVFQSDPITVVLALNETKQVDLDQDGINDLEVKFAGLVVNRVEITTKSLLTSVSSSSSLPEGKLIKYANSPKVYLIQNNQKRLIIDEQTFNYYQYHWSNIETISNNITYADGENIVKPLPTTSYNFTRDLKLGSTGEDVRQLQIFLNNNGFVLVKTGPGSPNQETTKFGSATKAALIKFQKANNITPAVGYFGPVTRGVVNR
ncbi:MAG: Ig-like domain-containing protein [Candidatus Buchananbacteria bacterium]